ncbi:hypothetical protein F4778DRAFT_456281 [Xylariomycetidae sp. FL2044]|nr:hypothetical protein F4778DRAFT_456281 [Xylariomycetidae sp. FL2044]
MAKEKKKAPAPARGVTAVSRRMKRERAQEYQDHIWRHLNPLKEPPKIKHKSYFQSVLNADKKKKLEFQIITDKNPPPGFEFIPTGHPNLSSACKELSREQDAMIFIVSESLNPHNLDHHMYRTGYHFRRTIVQQAREQLKRDGKGDHVATHQRRNGPEPIPRSQAEINREADAVLRDLFPRIPNLDRAQIIEHAFKKDGKFHGELKVGMATDLPLARRVQLAALAHIRHNHTRYDQLLRESDWANARKAVEKPCLDIIVKWRGDEETGRDQLEEILQEVIEISDTEDGSEDLEDESSDAEDAHALDVPRFTPGPEMVPTTANSEMLHRPHAISNGHNYETHFVGNMTPRRQLGHSRVEKRSARKAQQRFRRYAAAAQAYADSSPRNGEAASSDTATTRRNASILMPATSDRDSAVAMRGTPKAAFLPGRLDPVDSPYLNNRMQDDRVTMRPPASTETYMHVSPAGAFVERHIPKVGPSPSNNIRARTSMLPHVRASHPIDLEPVAVWKPIKVPQDDVLPSIEPPSPSVPRGLHNHSVDDDRMNHQTFYSIPGAGRLRPRYPEERMGDYEAGADHHHTVNHLPNGFVEPLGSSSIHSNHVRVPRVEDTRNGYLRSQGPVSASSPSRSDVFYECSQAWPVPREESTHHRREGGPSRTRADPIFIDGDGVYYRREDGLSRTRTNPILINEHYHQTPRRVITDPYGHEHTTMRRKEFNTIRQEQRMDPDALPRDVSFHSADHMSHPSNPHNLDAHHVHRDGFLAHAVNPTAGHPPGLHSYIRRDDHSGNAPREWRDGASQVVQPASLPIMQAADQMNPYHSAPRDFPRDYVNLHKHRHVGEEQPVYRHQRQPGAHLDVLYPESSPRRETPENRPAFPAEGYIQIRGQPSPQVPFNGHHEIIYID